MKRLLICLISFLFSTMYAQPECPMDSIGGGGAGVGSIDQSVIQQSPTYCTECSVQGLVSWELPTDFNGHVYIHSPNGQHEFSIQVVKDCRWVMMDTCLVLPSNPSNGAFDLNFAMFGSVQLYIGGHIGDTINIDCKSTPSPQEELTATLIDLSTCNTPTAIEGPTPSKYTNYLNIATYTRYNCEYAVLPAGLYWNYGEDQRIGRKVLK